MAGERFVTTDDGVELWTAASGLDAAGLPLILSHGGPGLWDEGEAVAEMIDDLVPVIRWDQRGGGRSGGAGATETFTIGRFVADLDAVRGAYGAERAIIAGHSWGAGLSLRYCLAHPERAAAFIPIGGRDILRDAHREAYNANRLERLGPDLPRWEELRALPNPTGAELRELNLLTSSTDYGADAPTERLRLARRWEWSRFPISYDVNAALNAETKTEDPDVIAERCRALGMPALVIHGDRDPRPLDGPTELAAALGSGELAVLEGVGHLPWAERPELFRDALRGFLERLPERHG